MGKRARERARQERQEQKRERRVERRAEGGGSASVDEAALMEEFRRLSEQREAEEIDEARYEEERHRIFVELGIESDD